ncbi:MAG: hypothetical protein JJE51_05310 [Thermoanaerobaculia bacterium]|nr:hypothetical protein [Thermoanaerobaculia bacterium]
MRHWSALRAGTVAALLMTWPLAAAMSDRSVAFVPWKVLDPSSPSSGALMILYWIPSQPDELKRSDMVHSKTLMAYAARCVAMRVVRADDSVRLASLDVSQKLPLAILVDAEGKVIGRLGGGGAPLRSLDVEMMVRTAFDERELSAEAMLDTARARVAAGDRMSAADLYSQVLAQRCAFPRLAKEAHRALRKLER